MTKTKEELEKLKQEYNKLTTELNALDEDELNEVVGAKNEFNIKPRKENFWQSFNPNLLFDNHGLNESDLVQHGIIGGPSINNPEFNGSLENREDKEK